MAPLPARSAVATFADRLLAADFPELPAERRRSAVAFVEHRIGTLPSVTRAGVLAAAAVFRVALVLPGTAVTGALSTLPLAGEYPRLVRSLGYAHIWETWPDTRFDGAPGAAP